ncbi:GNAT family N-acetyltransferase [Candidatus Poribacteria bacterium]|nr:GNAT family N-acetyltransferase [Candidatus Poribacteria bacterium]
MTKSHTAEVIKITYSKPPPMKSLVYLLEDSKEEKKINIPRSACVKKGDIIEVNGDNVFVICKSTDGKAQILPYYSEMDKVHLGDLIIPVRIKEITEPDEFEAFCNLQFHHYRGKALFGRHAPLVVCISHPLLPSVVGYIELTTPFLVSKPRHYFFDTTCKLNGTSWNQWNQATSRKYISLFVRIARCVVHPELQGTGIGQILVKHSIQFAQRHWQSGGYQPYVLEICADMLRYVPFAENAGMKYIGETEGNRHRIVKDFDYLIKNISRYEKKDILPGDSCGIVDAKRSQFQALINTNSSGNYDEAITDLKKQILRPTLKGDAKFKTVISYPKPVYIKGLHPDADEFIQKRLIDLNISHSNKTNYKLKEPIATPIVFKKVEVNFSKQVPRTKLTNQVERAFGTSLDTFEHTIFQSLDFSIDPESICLITGISGTGKSTLLKLLNNEIQMTKGKILIPDEAEITTLSPIGSKKPLIDVLGKGNMNRGIELMNSVGLSEAYLYVKSFQELSTGQKYRAMLAFLFSKDSNVWLLDEFCESLDPITSKLVSKKLWTTAKKHRSTVIVCSTDYQQFLDTLCPDQIILLQGMTSYRIFTLEEFQEFNSNI